MSNRKGIILAGGEGTRIYPLTKVLSKQLLPVFNKPMIYYPLCTLMLAGIREILIITTPKFNDMFVELLGNGSNWGLNLNYAIQDQPNGIAEGLIIAEDFLKSSPSAFILGDNIFYGTHLEELLLMVSNNAKNAVVFGCKVSDTKRFGIAEFDEKNNIINIEEKPILPKSRYAISGLYFFDENASKYAKELMLSDRGELEITDLNNKYIDLNNLKIELLDDKSKWFDAGTFNSLNEASNFISNLENTHNEFLGYPEIIAFKNGWISRQQLIKIISSNTDIEYFISLQKYLSINS